MNLKRGVSHFDIADIPLRFSAYINRAVLPPVPSVFGHVTSNIPPLKGGWGMLGNDTYGDCTMAGICHGQMVWDWATASHIPLFTSSEVVSQYMDLTGGADNGLDPVAVAQWWQNTGLTDAKGNVHKIRSFTALNSLPECVEAAYLFGFAGLAMWMPDNTPEQEFQAGQPWSDTSGDPDQNDGHYVPLVGRNSAGDFLVVTWGRLQAVTEEWLNKYLAGGVAYTSQDYMLATGLSPEGFNFDQLDDDLASL